MDHGMFFSGGSRHQYLAAEPSIPKETSELALELGWIAVLLGWIAVLLFDEIQKKRLVSNVSLFAW